MYANSWDEFEKAAQNLYLQNPMKVRYSLKYSHEKNLLKVKMTDNYRCLQYKTEIQQELKKIEKFVNNLMRHMASKEES